MKNLLRFNLIAAAMLLLPAIALSESRLENLRKKLPAPGEVLVNADASALTTTGADGVLATSQIVKVDQPGFSQASRIAVLKRGNSAWDVQLISRPSQEPVRKGDVIFFALDARCIDAQQETGEGKINLVLRLTKSPWTTDADVQTSISKQWQTIYVYAISADDFAAGDLALTLHLATIAQTLEIGGVVALDLGPHVDLHRLPFTPITYAGREADAPWRKKAAAQIEKYRKGDLTVIVENHAGTPLPGAAVSVEMTRHAYGFGSFLEPPVLEQSKNGELYRNWFVKLFNKATTPLYWADWGWANPEIRQRYLKMAAWLHDHHIPTRGHNLVWPSWHWSPTSLRQLEHDPQGLRAAIHDHVREVTEAMKPFDLAEIDVLNEPRVEHEFIDILGNDAMIDWFKTAHEADPRPKLFVNDYSILTAGGDTENEQASYEKTLQYLIDRGAPLDGIGMQGHFGSDLTPPEKLWKILDRFEKFNKQIEVTEFTVDTNDEAAQGDYERDFLTAMFAHPATIGVVSWGFWEGQIWLPQTALLRKDWTLKPSGRAYMDLVLHQWWTRAKGTSDADGRYTVRGFLGDYQIAVEFAGQRKTVAAKLIHDGTKIQIRLDE
jgi:endo-1,4-beta-xylanase